MVWAMKKAKHPTPKRRGVMHAHAADCRRRTKTQSGAMGLVKAMQAQQLCQDAGRGHPTILAMPSTAANSKFHALVPCAGQGSRAGTARPKQYQDVAGQPMVMHTLLALARVPQLSSAWVILSAGDDFEWPQTHWPAHFRRLACGGETRAASVFNGLSAMLAAGVPAQDWVLVHDAARCLIMPEAVSALIESCRDDAVGGLLALPLPDTLKSQRRDDGVARVASTVPREDKWLAQTPQMFRLGALHGALADAAAAGFAGITDESSAMERLGLSPRLVPGSAQNLKVTYPADFAFAEAVLKGRT
jgi:2-C-methyl-D-erythritol 4-phosphate cytidylyltransferase